MKATQKNSLVSPGELIGLATVDGVPITIKGSDQAVLAINALSQFGSIGFSRAQDFKKSEFSYHFIKPVNKLKQLYNLGNELLILCCNDDLTTYMSRAKDFIDYLLSSEYKNRLDKVTCFLISESADIEDIVKADRMANPNSRLIVPFSYDELKDGITAEFLQNRMRTFLYERDLFGIASPLQDDNLFFGKERFNIIAELYGKYGQGEHGGLFGLRRIGKTSILNLLRRRVEQNGGIAVYFDCTKYYHLRWNSFLHEVIKAIDAKYSKNSGKTPAGYLPDDLVLDNAEARYSEVRASLSFEADIKSLYRGLGEKRILLIFDEIEAIGYGTSPEPQWNKGSDALFFWQTLRSISQTDNSLFSFMIAGVNPKCIEDDKINGQPNPLFNILSPQYVALFDYNDVKSMVSEIGAHLGLQFAEEIFARLIGDYGGHPFLTRQVCSKINSGVLERKESRPYTVSKYSYEKSAADYQAKMEGVIKQILGVLGDYYPDEYELLKVLALNGSEAFKQSLRFGDDSVTHLLGYCLIKKDQKDYFIRIDSIANYLKRRHKFESAINDADEKRARVTIRRGKLEKTLRTIIRTQISLKFGKKAKEKMVAMLNNTTTDKSQESKLLNLDLKSAMDELYFSQLKILVLKDWNSYQETFHDKVKFEQFFDIVNKYRIDAHAKEIDPEEEALLTVAFRFFETALTDLYDS